MRVTSLSDSDTAEAWTRLRELSPTRSPFNQPAFVRCVWEAQGAKPSVLTVENGTARAAAVLFERQSGPWSRISMPAFVPFTPLVINDRPRESDINKHRSNLDAIESYLRSNYAEVRVHLPVGLDDTRMFSWKGWSVNPLYTPGADLTVVSDESSWSDGTAQVFRKHHPSYAISTDADGVRDAVALIAQSYANGGRDMPLPAAVLSEMIKCLLDVGLATVYVARSLADDNAEAGVIVLHDFPMSCYWLAGSLRGPAMTVLIGTILKDLGRDGFESIDFVGANTAGIAEFKRHFGTSLSTYFACTITPSPSLRILNSLRRR